MLLVGQELRRKGDLKMKEVTITEEKLSKSVAEAVSNILKEAPKDEECFGDFVIVHTILGSMIAAELRKILFGGGDESSDQ